ncbi:MAG: DEAD/DEAH box helicase [Aggregatilineales bacterium]
MATNPLEKNNTALSAIFLLRGADQIIRAALSQPPDAEAYQLRLQAEQLGLLAGFDSLICIESLAFQPFDHQIKAAKMALRRMRGRALLCDEVGLGKTIEAGLIIKEYLLRRMVQRVLVLTPPSLVEQWHEELTSKFDLPDFLTSTDPAFREQGVQAWETVPFIVASLVTARRAENRRVIEATSYDLVVVDEAHHLKNRSSITWKFVNALQKKYILLLTATPVQNSLDELYNLITILKPGLLKTPKAFGREFVVRGDPRAPKNRGMLRDLLADVMIRYTRSQVAIQLPPRRANTVRIKLSDDERIFYDRVSSFVRQSLEATNNTANKQGHLNRFVLQTLQREVGSCPQTALPTLRQLSKHQEFLDNDQEIKALIGLGKSVHPWSKAIALEKLLQAGSAAHEKVIIFTQFRTTLDLLAERLAALELNFVVYHGGLSTEQKERAIDRFEQEAQVLLSTEAAGEGRNLQFCRTLINFDLPWNPQRIEQRIGRIHRIGQTATVEIFNLSAEGTVEDYMLDILDRKLNMFELVIGEIDTILGHLSDERDFEELIFDTWSNAHTDQEANDQFEVLGQALLQARDSYQQTKQYDEALFGEDFSAES